MNIIMIQKTVYRQVKVLEIQYWSQSSEAATIGVL